MIAKNSSLIHTYLIHSNQLLAFMMQVERKVDEIQRRGNVLIKHFYHHFIWISLLTLYNIYQATFSTTNSEAHKKERVLSIWQGLSGIPWARSYAGVISVGLNKSETFTYPKQPFIYIMRYQAHQITEMTGGPNDSKCRYKSNPK